MRVSTGLESKTTLDRLFDIAAALFWEKGYTAATTREIAARAGIQQASLYHHFASKEDLLYKLGAASLDQLNAAVREATSHAQDPLDRINVFIRAHLATLLQHQIRHVTVLTELHALSPTRREAILSLRRGYAGFVQDLLCDAQRSGYLRQDITPEYLQLALLNMLNWVVFWHRHKRPARVDEIARSFASIFLQGAATQREHRPVVPSKARTARRAAAAAPASTRDRMLDRAAELFASKGYSATSTREIATGLGIRKASLYFHIDSKEDLLYALSKWSAERLEADTRAALDNVRAPLDRVRALISAHIESLLQDRPKHLAAISEVHLLSPERQAEVLAMRDRYERFVTGVLEEAAEAGALRTDVPLRYMSLALLGLVNRTAVWYRPDGKLTPRQLGALFAESFAGGAAK